MINQEDAWVSATQALSFKWQLSIDTIASAGQSVQTDKFQQLPDTLL